MKQKSKLLNIIFVCLVLQIAVFCKEFLLDKIPDGYVMPTKISKNTGQISNIDIKMIRKGITFHAYNDGKIEFKDPGVGPNGDGSVNEMASGFITYGSGKQLYTVPLIYQQWIKFEDGVENVRNCIPDHFVEYFKYKKIYYWYTIFTDRKTNTIYYQPQHQNMHFDQVEEFTYQFYSFFDPNYYETLREGYNVAHKVLDFEGDIQKQRNPFMFYARDINYICILFEQEDSSLNKSIIAISHTMIDKEWTDGIYTLEYPVLTEPQKLYLHSTISESKKLITAHQISNDSIVILFETSQGLFLSLVQSQFQEEGGVVKIEGIDHYNQNELIANIYAGQDQFVLLINGVNDRSKIFYANYQNDLTQICKNNIDISSAKTYGNTVFFNSDILIYDNEAIMFSYMIGEDIDKPVNTRAIVQLAMTKFSMSGSCEEIFPTQQQFLYFDNFDEDIHMPYQNSHLEIEINLSQDEGNIQLIADFSTSDSVFTQQFIIDQMPGCMKWDYFSHKCTECEFGLNLNEQFDCEYQEEVELKTIDGETITFKPIISRCVKFDDTNQFCIECEPDFILATSLLQCNYDQSLNQQKVQVLDESQLNQQFWEEEVDKLYDIVSQKVEETQCPYGCKNCSDDKKTCLDCREKEYFSVKDQKCEKCYFTDENTCLSQCPENLSQEAGTQNCITEDSSTTLLILLILLGIIVIIVIPVSVVMIYKQQTIAQKEKGKVQVQPKTLFQQYLDMYGQKSPYEN